MRLLHALQVIGLLDLGLALLLHGPAQRLARVVGGDGALERPRLVGGEVDALVLQRDLGRQGVQVSFRQKPRLG